MDGERSDIDQYDKMLQQSYVLTREAIVLEGLLKLILFLIGLHVDNIIHKFPVKTGRSLDRLSSSLYFSHTIVTFLKMFE